MAEHDDGAENDISNPMLEEHGDVRRRFVELWNVGTSGDAGALALDAAPAWPNLLKQRRTA